MAKTQNIDLSELLPKQYRDRTITTLIRALFNNHLSKDESVILHGFAGSEEQAVASDIYLKEADLERQVNQLTAVLASKHGTEERLVTWQEIVQRLVTLGVPYDSIGAWLKVEALNFVPFIDLDKFANFDQYVWVGSWLFEHPTLPWVELGIPHNEAVIALATFNPNLVPDYYVIARGELNLLGVPVIPYPDMASWSDWALGNMWVHKRDAEAFQAAHPMLNTGKLTQAIRPIIEFESTVKLNLHFANGAPTDSGALIGQNKNSPNQLPLFDLYHHNGEHSTYISAGFFYKEAADQAIDGALNRRITRDSAADLIFAHSFTDPTSDKPLFVKRYTGTQFELCSPWRGAADIEQRFVKYEASGTLINPDKLQNYESYYWAGAATHSLPAYNPTAAPEYVVLEVGGTSGWATDNRWKHVSELTSEQKLAYLPAQRPIIEFNSGLEAELLETKAGIGQLPRFKLYAESLGSFTQLPSSSAPKLADAYTSGVLFANLLDLPATNKAITTSAEHAQLILSVRDHQFAQSLLTGYYDNELDGIAYAYTAREFERSGAGDGQLAVYSLDSDALPHVLQLTGHADGLGFDVYSTVLGQLPSLTVNVPYSAHGATFTVISGTTAFDQTSLLRFDVRSAVFKKLSLHVKVDGAYRTVSSLADYLQKASLDNRLVAIDPSTGGGAWETPEPLLGNLDSTLAPTMSQGELYSHFTSIIKAQPTLTGTATSSNSWRNLTPNFSLGGIIKLYNDRLPLLLGMLCQDAADPISLLDFSQEAYSSMLNRAREFVEAELVESILADGSFLSAPGVIDDATYQLLKIYLEHRSAVVDSSASTVDDTVNSPFSNNSMTLKALTLTAPYLGLAPRVLPAIMLDDNHNTAVLMHHDGHKSSLPEVGFSTLKRLVTKRYKRSNGQETAGFIGGPIPPKFPFAKHLWLDMSGESLYVFDVVSDTGELTNGSHGQFSYDRTTGDTWQFNGSWVALGSDQSAQDAPWRKLDLASTLSSLLLKLELELYAACPPVPAAVNVVGLRMSARWPALMKKEFERFAAKFGIIDPYACAYDAANPFTWSYAGFVGSAVAWQDVYMAVYGTSRPDLYPHISCGYPTEAAFIAAMISGGGLSVGTTRWDVSYWLAPTTSNTIKSLLGFAGRPLTTSVDLTTGNLLPPYDPVNPEALLSVPPATPTRRFLFGELGPIERAWTQTVDYVTATAKTYFRLDPLTFIDACWGDERARISEYDIIRPLGRKPHIADVLIHGEPNLRSSIASANLTLTAVLAPFATTAFTIEVASAAYKLLRVANAAGSYSFCSASSIELGPYAVGALAIPRDGLNVGDKLYVTIDELGAFTVTATQASLGLEGLGQLYAHFHKAKALELSYSADRTSLLSWEPKLAYRFNSLVDTDALVVKVDGAVVDASGYQVQLKETTLQSASWLTGFKVTLLQKGSTQLVNGKIVPAKAETGQRGDDWVYRIDLTNANHPELEWYEHEAGVFETFYALAGKSSQDEWHRPTQVATLRSLRGPFIIKGLQALASFIFGYADRATELGFVFNDPADPLTDPLTGRVMGWQVLVEQLIDQQFNNPTDSSAFEVIPFKQRLAFTAAYGYISDLSRTGASTLVPGLYMANGFRAPKGSFRVFRDGASASITSDVPLAGALVTTSVFEHVVVFDNVVGDVTLNNPFMNQHVNRIFLAGFKQATPTGRPVYGGKYLVGNKMRTNMEGSVQQLGGLYDISSLKSEELFDHASSLISFDRKDYHAELGTTLPTQLQFWRGMLKSKGTNRAVSSFVNSSAYRSAVIDELWAYKVAEYGDLRRAVKVELNLRADDMIGERANYLLLEADEVATAGIYANEGGYDMTPYDQLAFDMFTLYSNEQVIDMDLLDPRGTIIVKPDDEARWNSFSDLGSISYMKAVVLAEMTFTPTSTTAFYPVRDIAGQTVLADCFELVDLDALTANVYDVPVTDITSYMRTGSLIYRESGDYLVGTNPAEYSAPKFKRINSTQLQVLDPTLVGKRLKVVAYGPPTKRFTPSELYRDDGGRDAPINRSVIWWDPARGSHSPTAHAIVDYQAAKDPARYNVTSLKHKSKTADATRSWGAEQVGKVWWDTERLGWMNYYDTKLYADHNERLAQWGSIADWADVNVYEWVEASVEPTAYAGEAAIKNYLSRSRTWLTRPVVWLYSANSQVAAKAPLKTQTATLELVGSQLIARSAAMPAFTQGERIARAAYTSTARTTLVKPIGTLEVLTGDVSLMIGALASNTAPALAVTPSFADFEVLPYGAFSSFATVPYGPLAFDYEEEGDVTYIRLTFTATGQSQRALLPDTPVKAGTKIEVTFIELGVKLRATALYGQADSWGSLGALSTTTLRTRQLGIELGSSAHGVYARQALAVTVLIDIGATTLDGSASVSSNGWVSWKEPTRQLSTDDLNTVYGSWATLTGDWSEVGTALADRKVEIQAELSEPQPVLKYNERWTSWMLMKPQINEATYYTTPTRTHAQALEELGFTLAIEDVVRSTCFVNGKRIVRGVTAVSGVTKSYAYFTPANVTQGSKLRIELPFKVPTGVELNLKLEGNAVADPAKLTEYKLDTPYVKLEERNEFGRIAKTRYFFWAKNKELPANGKAMSVKLAAQQLKQHPGPYAVPQILKRFNQLDGRPNRYAMLTIVDLARFVKKDDRYKLRITENGSMRNDDEDITLRTTHSEWQLIRKNQPTKLPKELWDKLVDTLCAETATGQALPYAAYSEYDARNETTSRIGLKQGQVLADAANALLTVKGTLLNTQVVTYDVATGTFGAAPLAFAGYYPLQLDTYLSTPIKIREFMSSIWNYGAPRSINELFFAVLEDSLAASAEVAGIMKTSFITLDEVRTVVVEG